MSTIQPITVSAARGAGNFSSIWRKTKTSSSRVSKDHSVAIFVAIAVQRCWLQPRINAFAVACGRTHGRADCRKKWQTRGEIQLHWLPKGSRKHEARAHRRSSMQPVSHIAVISTIGSSSTTVGSSSRSATSQATEGRAFFMATMQLVVRRSCRACRIPARACTDQSNTSSAIPFSRLSSVYVLFVDGTRTTVRAPRARERRGSSRTPPRDWSCWCGSSRRGHVSGGWNHKPAARQRP